MDCSGSIKRKIQQGDMADVGRDVALAQWERAGSGVGPTPLWLSIWPYMAIFVVVLIVMTVVFVIWNSRAPRTAKHFTDYFVVISSLAIVFVLITILVADLQRQYQDRPQEVLSIVAQTQTNGIGLEKQFLQDPDLLRLYKQMYPQISRLRALPDPPITQNVVRKEINMIQQMLNIIENVNLIVTQQTNGWDDPIAQTWLTPFQSWMMSPLIRQQWEETRSLFSRATNDFIEQRLLPPQPSAQPAQQARRGGSHQQIKSFS
jgi:hypothetical protein